MNRAGAGVGDIHRPTAAAETTAAARPDETPLRTTVAPVVADAQSVDAKSAVAGGGDVARVGHGHTAAIARVAASSATRRSISAAAVPRLTAAAVGKDAVEAIPR